MYIMGQILFLFCVFIFSILITRLVRKYSLRNALIDIPNERSLHDQPTPRGGGLSIVLASLTSFLLMYYFELITLDILLALLSGGSIVAVIGWLDDHRHISPVIRGLIYTAAAIITLMILGGLPSINVGKHYLTIPLFNNIVAVFGIVWLINLYNFMDGADAFAAIQTICVCLFLGLLFLLSGQHGLAVINFIVVMATAGFLYWNWPPARIFMGDVGSCFIGFFFGSQIIISEKSDSVTAVVFLILLGVFICDATFTLIMRIVKNEKWYSAHKSHAYQRIVQMGMSHKQLVLSLLVINVFFLWPMAYIAFRWEQLSILLLIFEVLVLFILWVRIQIRYNRFKVLEG